VSLFIRNARDFHHYARVALAVRRKPESRFEPEAFDVSGELVHPRREPAVDGGPVSVIARAVSLSLPAVVYLYVIGAVVFQVLREPSGVQLDFTRVDVLIVVIPRAPS